MVKEKLVDIIKKLTKKYGEGTVMKFDNRKTIDIEIIPTGSISLDYALGISTEEPNDEPTKVRTLKNDDVRAKLKRHLVKRIIQNYSKICCN